ncbi:probable transcriptional regulatory protein Dole_0371 [Ylistrum balloti]|uniref:probable transcriptional regulatory protein Dole_0371 n=1 Tax=Ylistrum balloti TaxID=509963 RepID=UPI00290598FD|nr:probable transcriptional regulatory protein Dole_0371 [Ylistrum balloti]
MSGHSKWATIKHRKGLADAKRGKLFSKIAREITVAARNGGGDTASNPRLKTVIMTARSASMPNKNIENAIRKGTGESKDGVDYMESTYEGYGPYGVAILVNCLTDNKNRTVAEVKKVFSKNTGNLGEIGSVAWQFEKKGVIHIEKGSIEEDQILGIGLELPIEDVISEEEGYIIYTTIENFNEVYEQLKENKGKSFELAHAEISMIPKNTIEINKDQAEKLQSLIDQLDDLDDVTSISSNELVRG